MLSRTAGAREAPGPRGNPVLATLRVRSGLSGSPTVSVWRPQAVIGSDPASDVVLPGEGVAARHAQLRLRSGVWTYTDFGSPGGSLVDGRIVHGEALLAPGSSIRVGDVSLAFAPSDRWDDSPPERRSEARAPLLLMPTRRFANWPSTGFWVVLAALAVAGFFLFRNF